MKIAIIGGGAAGMMAAAAAHEADGSAEIFVIEKNDGLGKKVIISGGGRCNLTTGIQDVKIVLTKYPRGGKFLSKAMHKFSPEDVYGWFEGHGVPLKVEEDMRVFPKSNNGKDVVAVFEKMFRNPSIKILFNSQVEKVRRIPNGFEIFLKGKTTPLSADKLIVTTGGQAYRQTGSTGDGYAFAQTLGHSITPLAPSLSSLETKEKWVADLAGVSFPYAELSCRLERSETESKDHPKKGPSAGSGRLSAAGPFIFTHRGLSGPAIFALSSQVAFQDISADHPLPISIDFMPDRKLSDVTESVLFHLAKYPKKSLSNVLAALVAKSVAFRVCLLLGMNPDASANEYGKKDAERIAKTLKDLVLHAVSRSSGEEFVTAGGVELKEVDPSTMESKICPGLYLAGEILNIDGFTGGFNLQSAWSTGHLAGESAASL